MTGWGEVFEGRLASKECKEKFLSWHINCLELRAVFLVLKYFLPVSLGDSDQAGFAVPASGQDLASSTRALEVVGMAHTGPRAVIDVLPCEVQETIASARAPATRKLYSSKWGTNHP